MAPMAGGGVMGGAETSGVMQGSLGHPLDSSVNLLSDRSLRTGIFSSWLSRKPRACLFGLTLSGSLIELPRGLDPDPCPPYLLPAFIKFLTFV